MKSTRQPTIAFFYDATVVVQRRAVTGFLQFVKTCKPWNVILNEVHEKPSVPADCAGIVLCAPDAIAVRKFQRLNLPLVLINLVNLSEADQDLIRTIPSIDNDSRLFGIQAADYFLRHPDRTFVYVGLPKESLWDREREQAFVTHLRTNDKEAFVYPRRTRQESPTAEQRRLSAWLADLPKPMSIFAVNDARARLVLAACIQAGLSVPDEAALLGVDNDEWICDATLPRLSSIASRAEEGGFEAACLLDEILSSDKHDSTRPHPQRRLLSPVQIIERESTEFQELSDPIVSRALAFIKANKGLNIRVTEVARFLGVSISWLETLFQRELGRSIVDEIASVRLKTVLTLIETTNTPLKEIARLSGFTNTSTLCRLIKKATGRTAGELRQ